MNRFKLVAVVIMALVIISCGVNDNTEIVKGTAYDMEYGITCIDGVEYLLGWRQMSPHMKPDGTVYTCEENE